MTFIMRAFLSPLIQALVSAQPAVEFRKEDDGSAPTFDFHFNVELTEDAGIEAFPDCLPDQVKRAVVDRTVLDSQGHWNQVSKQPITCFRPLRSCHP